ncbi:MAG: FHA domain-containing protein [Chitinispirillia bacterium]|nr:FHA domain-containing protein [Chitinispirillia bacterium]MCL2268040.1 FHA domain-containing protein [Chitinispirillia bacterium]
MTRYTVYFNGEQVKSYELDEPVIFIGRLPENHIPISNMGISRRHVKIELDPSGAYTLSDLNSLNGTLVNGKKVKKVSLFHGDKITIGKYTILYEDFRGGPGAAHLETIVADFRQEDMRRIAEAAGLTVPPASTPLPTPAPPPAAQSAAVDAAPAEFLMMQPAAHASIPVDAPIDIPLTQLNAAAGKQPAAAAADSGTPGGAELLEVTSHIKYKLDRNYLTIGSDEEDDIYASGFMISKSFAAIEQRSGLFYITALKMSKFKVNGKNVKSHRLEHRDRIEIGSNTFRFMENG